MRTAKSDALGSQEAEIAMLGAFVCCDFDRSVALETAREEMLQHPKVKVAWRHLTAMCLGAKEIGLYELAESIKRAGESGTCDLDFLINAVEGCPNTQAAARYAARVRDYWQRRRMMSQVEEIKKLLAAPDADDADPSKVWSQMTAIMADQSANSVPTHIGDIVGEAMEPAATSTEHPTCGIPKLDTEINFFEPGEMTVLAARPGGGKSSFMRQLLWGAGERGPALVFTLEVTPKVLTQQITCEAAKVPFDLWRRGLAGEDGQSAIVDAMSEVAARKIYIFPRATVSTLDVTLAVTQMEARGLHPSLVAIDYLGLMKHEKSERQDLSIGATTRALKMMALDKRVPVLLLCQMNRQAEQRGSASEYDRPRLADLRDSGTIEQDADNVVFLWKRNRDEGQMTTVERVLTVAKRRIGSVFEADLMFDMPHGRFYAQVKYPTPVDEFSGGGANGR